MAKKFLKVCWWVSFGIAFFIIVSGYFHVPPDPNKKYLYESDSVITEVTDSTGFFLTSRNPRVVIFYSPYCPHCVRFRDTFSSVASKTHSKHKSVEFYGVSCIAIDSVCRKYSIETYPTVLAMPEGSSADKYETVGQLFFSVGKVEKALHLS